jgi:hypothetical protein
MPRQHCPCGLKVLTKTLGPRASVACLIAFLGSHHFSLRCFFRSSIASISAVVVVWLLLDSFGILGERVGNGIDFYRVLLIGLAVNVVADFVSLLETRLILHHIHRIRSIILQALVLVLDVVVSAVVILLALRAFTYVTSEPYSAELILAAFSVYSVFFFSTFMTSICTWTYLFSTWFIRALVSIRLSRYSI